VSALQDPRLVQGAIERRFREVGIEIPLPVRKQIQEGAGAAPEKRSQA
jgi:hypothetical protein